MKITENGRLLKVGILGLGCRGTTQLALLHGMQDSVVYPFHSAEFIADKDKSKEEFEFVPSREVVLDNLVPSYICGYVYSSLVDSYCVEQNARFLAMKSASDNASEILSDLNRAYNHARQSEITTEITEISSGAKFQRSKIQ